MPKERNTESHEKRQVRRRERLRQESAIIFLCVDKMEAAWVGLVMQGRSFVKKLPVVIAINADF